ncbi:hypothetical protein BHE74_00030116 [Ensete ventricosum]|nr:hypothetical protein BHE74_00030116 [Ensete ventricosum]
MVHISLPAVVAKGHFQFFVVPSLSTSLVDQVGMVSSPSFSVSSFSSPLSSPVPPPREERHRSSDSLRNQSGPESSSSGMMTRADAKVLQALEAMESHHDFDSTVCPESSCSGVRATIVPPLSRGVQYLYRRFSGEAEVPPSSRHRGVSQLVAGIARSDCVKLLVLYHNLSQGIMSMMRDNPRTGGGHPGTTSSVPILAPLPPSAPRVESGSASDMQEIPVEEARGAPEVSQKRRGGDSVGQRKKDQRKSPHKADKAATKGKGPTDVSDEPPTSRRRPKSVRELCSASAEVDGRDYHAIRMCNLLEQASDAPLEPDLRPLTHGMPVWQRGEASATYIRGMLIPRLATDLYTLPSEVLMDGATKAMVLVTLVEANGRRALVEADLEVARAESTSIERQLADLRERLDDSEGQLRGARAQVHQMETELLDLARSKKALREDLQKKAVEDYKKSPGFEIGLVRMGRVSLEYGYQLVLA